METTSFCSSLRTFTLRVFPERHSTKKWMLGDENHPCDGKWVFNTERSSLMIERGMLRQQKGLATVNYREWLVDNLLPSVVISNEASQRSFFGE
jgi:hypothetical protein